MNKKHYALKATIIGGLIVLAVVVAFLSNTLSAEAATRKTTNISNMFSIENQDERYILLDSTDEGFYVLTQMYYGTKAFDPDDTSRFDIEDTNNLAYYLNNDFLVNGNGGKRLSNEIQAHLVEREWDIEAGYPGLEGAEAYTVKAKVASLSRAEWEKYSNFVGYADDTSNSWWYLRSPMNNTIGNGAGVIAVVTTSGSMTAFKNTRGNSIRPSFYLDKDFFKKVRINTSLRYLGDNVKIALRNNYTKEDLAGIYSEEELKTIFDDPLMPTASVIGIRNYPGVGCELEALYEFNSPSGKKDGGSVVRWLKSKTQNGIYTVVAKGTTYAPKPEDVGYYMKVDVVPIDEDGTMGMTSEAFLIPSTIRADHKPVVANVYLIGETSVGTRLILNYNYSDENRDKERKSIYVWERTKDGEHFEVIQGATTKNYTLTKKDAGYAIRASVLPRNDVSNGEKVYTPLSEVVFNNPSVESISLIQGSGYAEASYKYIGDTDERDTVIWWETAETENGKYVRIADSSAKRISTEGLEGRFIRVAVIPKDSAGHLGEVSYSPSVKVSGNKEEIILGSFTPSEISAGVKMLASGKLAPKILIINITSTDADAITITSELYNVFKTVTGNTVRCTLSLKDGDIATGNIEIAELAGGSMTVNSISAGIYNEDGTVQIGSYMPVFERR